jgi:hypothetical protein
MSLLDRVNAVAQEVVSRSSANANVDEGLALESGGPDPQEEKDGRCWKCGASGEPPPLDDQIKMLAQLHYERPFIFHGRQGSSRRFARCFSRETF